MVWDAPILSQVRSGPIQAGNVTIVNIRQSGPCGSHEAGRFRGLLPPLALQSRYHIGGSYLKRMREMDLFSELRQVRAERWAYSAPTSERGRGASLRASFGGMPKWALKAVVKLAW